MKTKIKKHISLSSYSFLIILLVLYFTPLISYSQWECLTNIEDVNNQKQLGIDCDNWYNYADYPNTKNIPIKTVRVAYHIIQDGNGNGNFQNLEADKNFLKSIIQIVNNRLANLDELTVNGLTGQVSSPYVKDCRIRLFLDTIYFHKDAELWDFSMDNSALKTKITNTYNKWILNNNSIDEIGKNHTLNLVVGGNKNTS